MTRGTRVAAALAAVTLMMASCSTGSDDQGPDPQPVSGDVSTDPGGAQLINPGPKGTPRGGIPDKVDNDDPESVAAAAAETNYTLDTKIDKTPADGIRRAKRWLTPDYAEAVSEPRPSTGGADWIALAEQDGYTTVTSIASDERRGGQRISDRERVLTRIVTITSHTAGGAVTDTTDRGVSITVTRATSKAPWRVSAITEL